MRLSFCWLSKVFPIKFKSSGGSKKKHLLERDNEDEAGSVNSIKSIVSADPNYASSLKPNQTRNKEVKNAQHQPRRSQEISPPLKSSSVHNFKRGNSDEDLVCYTCLEHISASYISIQGKNYHPDCFKCIACNEVIQHSTNFLKADLGTEKEEPIHKKCFDEMYGKKCTVCFDRSVAYSKHVFFNDEILCTKHITDDIRRCDACKRYESKSAGFIDVTDCGRCLCSSCYRTVILNSEDMTTLWNKVIDFFQSKLQLPICDGMRRVPVVSVGSETLNDCKYVETSDLRKCRGMCLSEYSGSLEVSAILCLAGLPSDLTGSILAHEATHAWLRLHPDFVSDIPIPPFVEEGLCQLVAYLFLSEGLSTPSKVSIDGGPSEEKLRQFFRFSIESDECPVYGLGFRKASEAYAEIGIEPLISHVLRYRDFPQI